jgi:hypothetical protein
MACPVINLRLMTVFPALLGEPGARATRDLATLDYAQTGRELLPASPAMLGCARRAFKPRRFTCRSALMSAMMFCPPDEPGGLGEPHPCVPTPRYGTIPPSTPNTHIYKEAA